jgi:putative transposase
VLTARTKATDRMLTFCERHSRIVLAEYAARKRMNSLPQPRVARPTPATGVSQQIKHRTVLGGMPNETDEPQEPGQALVAEF